MAPKKALAVAAKGRSKSTTPTRRLIDEDNADPAYVPQSESTRAREKRHRSRNSSIATEDARAKKREHQQREQARKASLVDEELRQQRVRESTTGVLSSVPVPDVVPTVRDDVSTTDGAEMIDGSATDGVLYDDPAGSRKQDPPTF
uniref:Integrase core domain containing protein n=1 Tax=Solanum tuberosum TaxID=4113 RepID=M1DFE3_SOLTU